MPPPINPPNRPPDHDAERAGFGHGRAVLADLFVLQSAEMAPIAPMMIAPRMAPFRKPAPRDVRPRLISTRRTDGGRDGHRVAAVHRHLHRGRRDGGDASGDGVSGIGPQPNTLIDGNRQAGLR